jgi:hypothetical protein
MHLWRALHTRATGVAPKDRLIAPYGRFRNINTWVP